MKTWIIVILIVLLATSAVACKKNEASGPNSTPGITPYTDTSLTGKFAGFNKLPVAAGEPDPDGVEFKGIGFAADEAYIMVQFSAPLEQSELWQQDYIWVVDEKTLRLYRDIPIMPVVGPLIGRPNKDGQVGYVMLMNHGYGIKRGSVVSIVLGKYKREHYTVP